jgi:hypothetical protein
LSCSFSELYRWPNRGEDALEKLLELELEVEVELELEEEEEVEEDDGVELDVEVDADAEVEVVEGVVVEGVVEVLFVYFLECRSAVTARYFLRRSWRVISSMSAGT